MIKECQKEMIVLQTQESRLFESAYFILRRKSIPPAKSDMIAEANRIIAMGGECLRERKPRRCRRWWWFLLGSLLGGGLSLLLCLLL